ncbi:MAG TPA: CBS domain-containing protein [Rhodocyclaceae bacterium]
MKTLSQVLGARHGAVVTVGPRESVEHARKLMADHAVAAVLVMQNGHAVGLVNEQDCARADAERLRVQEIMKPVVCAPQQTTVRDAMAMMAERHISHLPVLDDHKDVVGLVSMRTLSQEVPAA